MLIGITQQIGIWRADDCPADCRGGYRCPRGTGFQNGILPGEFVQPQGFSVGAPILGARAVQGQRTINVGRIRCHFHLFSLNPNLLESQPGGRPGWAPLRTEETCFHSTKQAKCFRWRASVASPTVGVYISSPRQTIIYQCAYLTRSPRNLMVRPEGRRMCFPAVSRRAAGEGAVSRERKL